MPPSYQRFIGGSLYPSIDPHLPYPKPLTFAGLPSESVECFISSVLLHLQINQNHGASGQIVASEKLAVVFASSLLRGPAHDWFVELCRHNMHEFIAAENAKHAANPKSKTAPLEVESRHAFNWMIYPFIIHDLHRLEWFLAALHDKFPHAPTAAQAAGPAYGERVALPAYST